MNLAVNHSIVRIRVNFYPRHGGQLRYTLVDLISAVLYAKSRNIYNKQYEWRKSND
jgi:hypothetical protein